MKTYLLVLFSTVFSYVSAQTSVLNQYIQQGITENIQGQKHRLSIEEQTLKLAEVKGTLLPRITFDANYFLSNGGRTLDFPLGDLFNPINATLNELTGSADYPTNFENIAEPFSPHNFQDTKLKLQYSIFNRANYYNYKAQAQLIDVEESKKRTFEQTLTKDIKIAYYQYFKLDALKAVVEQSQQQLLEVLHFNKKLVKYQQVTEDVLVHLAYEIEKNKSQLIGLHQQKENAKAYFNTLLNRDLGVAIQADSDLKTQLDNSLLVEKAIDLRVLQNQAFQNSPALLQLFQSTKINETITTAHRKSFLPTLGVEIATGFQGTGYQFNRDQAITTIGFGLNWVLYDGQQRKRKIEQLQVASAKIAKDYEQVKQQIQLEVLQYFHALTAAKHKAKVEEVALKSAKKRFDLTNKRYQNHQVLLIELLDAQTKYTNAQLMVQLSKYEVLIQLAELERAANL